MNAPRVAVSIVTRNRATVLERTLRKLERLDPAPDEILVYADACSDDTSAMLAREFPRVRVLSGDVPRGSIQGRDQILREATAGIVLCIIGLVVTTINAAVGAYLGATGQLNYLK